MESRFNYIADKIDGLDGEVKKIDKNLAVTMSMLQAHIDKSEELYSSQKEIIKHVAVVRLVGKIGIWIIGTGITFLVTFLSGHG